MSTHLFIATNISALAERGRLDFRGSLTHPAPFPFQPFIRVLFINQQLHNARPVPRRNTYTRATSHPAIAIVSADARCRGQVQAHVRRALRRREIRTGARGQGSTAGASPRIYMSGQKYAQLRRARASGHSMALDRHAALQQNQDPHMPALSLFSSHPLQ